MIEPPERVLSAFTGTWMHSSPASTPAWKSAALYPPPDTAIATRAGRTAESGRGTPCGQVVASAVHPPLADFLWATLSAAVSASHQTITNPTAIAVDAPPLIRHRRAGPRPKRGRTRIHSSASSATITTADPSAAASSNQL